MKDGGKLRNIGGVDVSRYETSVVQEPLFLRVTLAGDFSMPRTLHAFDRVAEEVKRHGASKVLIDARDVLGVVSDSQQYELGKYVAAHMRFKFALIDHAERRSYFAEWVAVEGGADARLFADEPRALAWLLKA